MKQAEFIVCPAIYAEKKYWIGNDYKDCIRRMNKANISLYETEYAPGFITSTNRFVNSEEAASIARRAGQIPADAPTTHLRPQDLHQ